MEVILCGCGVVALWRPGGQTKGRQKSEMTKSLCFTAFGKPVPLQAPQGLWQPDSRRLTQPCHTSKPQQTMSGKTAKVSSAKMQSKHRFLGYFQSDECYYRIYSVESMVLFFSIK